MGHRRVQSCPYPERIGYAPHCGSIVLGRVGSASITGTEYRGRGGQWYRPGTPLGRPEVAAAYEQARLRFELAEAVRARREDLGLSQRQTAERAGMTQPGIARFEAGGTTPTLPLLERLATALGLTLNVSLAPAGRRSA